MYCMCDKQAMLPKLEVEALQCIWEKSIPKDYPKTSSEFSLKFDSETTKEAVETFEESLKVDSSVTEIINSEMLPENTILGTYMGTYNVKGVVGEKTLISPQRVPENATGVIAMHYNEETSTWEKIEDVEIIDGYVYATMESFSPISIVTIKRDTYLTDSCQVFVGKPVFVANGVPIIIAEKDGKTIVTDANGKETELTALTVVYGGTVDGSFVENTSVFVKGVTKNISTVYAGSSCIDKSVAVKNAKVEVEDSTITSGIVGAAYNNRLDNLSISIKNSKVNFTGTVDNHNYVTGKNDNITLEDAGYGLKSWCKKANIKLFDSDIYIVYFGGTNGITFSDEVIGTVKNCKCGYFTCSGSNGKTNNVDVSIENTKITTFQTVNRGVINSVKVNLKDCSADIFAALGDPTDSSVNGVINNVKMEISGNMSNVCIGTTGGTFDLSKDNNIIDYIKVSRGTNLEYKTDLDRDILSGYIVRK